MALIRSVSVLAFLRPSCTSCVDTIYCTARPRTLLVRQSSTEAQSAGRVKLCVDEAVDGASCVQHLPMKYYYNRNPRSTEILGTAEKPRGFGTTIERADYYHRLVLTISLRHVSAHVEHNSGTKVIEASTKEFCISRHLYKTSDITAAFNIGRVIAMRCKDAGLTRVMWQHRRNRYHKKVTAFIDGIKCEKLIMNEPKVRKYFPMDGSLPKY